MNSPRHRTKGRTRHLAPLAGALLMALVTPATAGAPWQARLVPAALNRDRTVHLVAGHTQPVILMLQASDGATGSDHELWGASAIGQRFCDLHGVHHPLALGFRPPNAAARLLADLRLPRSGSRCARYSGPKIARTGGLHKMHSAKSAAQSLFAAFRVVRPRLPTPTADPDCPTPTARLPREALENVGHGHAMGGDDAS